MKTDPPSLRSHRLSSIALYWEARACGTFPIHIGMVQLTPLSLNKSEILLVHNIVALW